MSITTPTYFQAGNLFIANINNLNTEIPGVPNSEEDIQLFIDIYEREILINALGIILYNEFQAELPTPTTQKWIDLLDGKTYAISGKSYIWDGLTGVNNQSLLAAYIYCQYLRNDSSIYTTTGVVLPKAANSQDIDPTPKYITAYNQFINNYQGEDTQYNDNPHVIINRSGMIGLDYYGSRNGNFANLYQYLTDQNTLDPTSFPDLEFNFYYRENSWGV